MGLITVPLEEFKRVVADLKKAVEVAQGWREEAGKWERLMGAYKERAEAAEKLHDAHCPLVHLQNHAGAETQRCIPPWKIDRDKAEKALAERGHIAGCKCHAEDWKCVETDHFYLDKAHEHPWHDPRCAPTGGKP